MFYHLLYPLASDISAFNVFRYITFRTGAATLTALEDLYQPYKKKRSTRASIAREKGLEPLAELILGLFKTIVSLLIHTLKKNPAGQNSHAGLC